MNGIEVGRISFNFAGRSVLVTGATGGMGLAISSAFVRSGASVLMCDRLPTSAGDDVAATLTGAGLGRAVYTTVDVAVESDMSDAVQRCVDRFGQLDHAVNAAAIENESVPLHECDSERFDQIMSVNVNGVFFSMKHELRAMLDNASNDQTAPHCSIVNIASTNSYRPQPNQPAYTASKHAVLGLTRSAGIDYAALGVRVNAICPGSIDTPMLRQAMERRGRQPADVASRLSLLGRFGTPDEIAEAALWLSSGSSSFTLGHALAVDAGYLAR